MGKLQPKADIGIFIGYAPTKKAFRIYNRRTRRIIETIHVDFDELTAMASEHSSSVPPTRSDWDLLFQPMFDESPNVDVHAPETPTPIFSHDVEEDNHDIEVAHMGNDQYFGIPIPEVSSDQSSSDVIHKIVHPDHPKDHPLENIIGALDRPVSTRLQLHEQALFCYYDAFLTSVEPKNYKE
ncbi:hypothetical protein Tco_0279655, partial [Tanacetum coccineum]